MEKIEKMVQNFINNKNEIEQEIEEIEKSLSEKIKEITINEEKEDKIKNENFEPTKIEIVKIEKIIIKIEETEVVYEANLSNGEKIKVYPNRRKDGLILERSKEKLEQIKNGLINYSIARYIPIDKKVIKKIDPVICEVLMRFAKEYNEDASNLVYNYAMTYSKKEDIEIDEIPLITYILHFEYFDENIQISQTEKETLIKICKNARGNEYINVVGYYTGISKIKYFLQKVFNIKNYKTLAEGNEIEEVE